MAKRYRGPAGSTPTASEFILSKTKLVQEIGNYISRVASLDPAPIEFIMALRTFQAAVELCRADELAAYQQHFEQVQAA